MQVKELRVNQLIEITVDEEDNDYKNLASRIEEITEQHVHISVPMLKGEILPLRVGLRVIINFVNDGHSYAFASRIAGRKTDPLPLLSLLKPEKIDEIQRRKWVRLAVSIPVHFSVNGEKNGEIYQGTTLDISGGGVLFVSSTKVMAGQLLNLQIEVPKRGFVVCRGVVLRSFQDHAGKQENYRVIIEFIEIAEGQRDKIMSFIFEKQREWIRKGLL